jgi:hypothetical protein
VVCPCFVRFVLTDISIPVALHKKSHSFHFAIAKTAQMVYHNKSCKRKENLYMLHNRAAANHGKEIVEEV